MSELLTGRTLVWSCYDPSGVIIAAAHSILKGLLEHEPIKLHLIPAQSASDVSKHGVNLGISFWRLSSPHELPSICDAITSCRHPTKSPICIVYHEPELMDCVPILCESGAQVVVSQLPSLQQALGSIISKVPLSFQGFHPLTSGLVERLPWPRLDLEALELR